MEKFQGALEQVWAVKKTGVTTQHCELWSFFTVTITVPYIKQNASQPSASGEKIYRLRHRIAYLTTSIIWNQIVKDHHRRLVQILQESFFLSYTVENEDFFKIQPSNRPVPPHTKYLNRICKKEIFKKGEKIYTEKPSETSESVLTGYGVMLIKSNQESEWVHQVVRNIPSPALSIQWDNSDFEAEKK